MSDKMGLLDKDLIDPVVEGDEVLHRFIRAGIATIPVVGGAAVEVFASIVTSPVEKRKQEWMIHITDVCNELITQEVVTLEKLQHDDRFISILMQVSNAAVQTHDEEKLEMLKNAVKNFAVKDVDEQDDVDSVLLHMAFQMPPLYLKILRYVIAPEIGNAKESILKLFSEMNNDEELADAIWVELLNKGLVNRLDLNMNFYEDKNNDCTTDLGKRLIDILS